MINQLYSLWRLVTSEVLEGFALEPVLCNIFLNGFKESTELSFVTYADDDAKFGGIGFSQWQGYHPKGPRPVGGRG